ncbi:MAG: protein phosphatase 2C domain-containing protein [Betaproteobacteria bacterium]|nr:protein phosphatase 2C domain-containing protein [Betaproteobacteria bacterium]
MKCTIHQETHVGRRAANQDRLGHWRTPESVLLVVADGMGGHAHGEVAAELTLRHIAAAFKRDAQPRLANPDLFLFRAVGRSHGMLLREAQALGLTETPRTTVVACVVQDGRAHWSHVGDSRLYLVRKGEVLVRTRDHTLVQQLIDEGKLRESEAGSHPERNRLLQCVGGAHTPRIAPTAHARLERDDIVLLCSDGFWGPLSPRQILAGLVSGGIAEAIVRLCALAQERAGPDCDNVSAVALAWGEDAAPFRDGPSTVPVAEMSTEVQDFGASDAEYLRMTDDDIERAVADIKNALKRRAPR